MFRERGTHARPHPLDGFFLVRRDRRLTGAGRMLV